MLSRWPLVARAGQIEMITDVLARRDRAGALIFGPAGVGKTRLATECRHLAETDGRPTEWIVGSYATQNLPLAAAAAFVRFGVRLSAAPGAGLVGGFERVRQALVEKYDGRRVVVIADDLHRLDATSLELLFHLMAKRTVVVIGTVRTGDPVPDSVTGLWRAERMVRVDLADLDRQDFDTLLHLALGGPIEAGAQFELWAASKGNPLYVRELVMGALEAGTLIQRDGVWHLEGSLPHTERLGDLVAERMGHLDPRSKAVVEILALCQPLPLDYVVDLVGGGLSALEESGRVSVSADSREVTLGHPVFGEFLRRHIPPVRARELFRQQAERLESQGKLSRLEQLQVAEWRLNADGHADPMLLMEGAQAARLANDFRSVQRLVNALPAEYRGPRSWLLLGEALSELGSCEEAERTLARVHWRGVDEDVLLRIVLTRTNNLQFGLCDSTAALKLNADAQQHIQSEPYVHQLRTNEASIQLLSGRPDRALGVLDGQVAPDESVKTIQATVLVPALALAGRTREAVAISADIARRTELGFDVTSGLLGVHHSNHALALTEAGRLTDAALRARASAETAARVRLPKGQIRFALQLGRIAIVEGAVATARRFFAEAVGLATTYPFAGLLGIALAGLAATCAMLGDLNAAREALKRREALPPFGFLGPEQELGRAWTLAVAGEKVAAEECFLNAADLAAATGHRTSEAWILHDLLRACGRNESGRLATVAAETDSALVTARADHAFARRAGDADSLVQAAEQFLGLGARLLAAEALTSAADAHRRAGSQRRASEFSRRAGGLAATCEGARTPDLILADTVAPLSRRERDVARLAATGLQSKEIAARLSLSVRTVDNYLQRAYTKLGVANRTDLAAALRATP